MMDSDKFSPYCVGVPTSGFQLSIPAVHPLTNSEKKKQDSFWSQAIYPASTNRRPFDFPLSLSASLHAHLTNAENFLLGSFVY